MPVPRGDEKLVEPRYKFFRLKDEEVLEGEEGGKYGCRCPSWAPRCWDITWLRGARVFTSHMFKYLAEDSDAIEDVDVLLADHGALGDHDLQTARPLPRNLSSVASSSQQHSGGSEDHDPPTSSLPPYEYFLRLDSDVFFVDSPEFDPLRMLQYLGCAFGYHRLSIEAPGCFDGFEQYTGEFALEHGLEKPNIHIGRGVAAAGGMITAGDLRLFTSPLYRKFAGSAAREGLFENRWADQILFAAAVIMLGNAQFCFHPLFQNVTEVVPGMSTVPVEGGKTGGKEVEMRTVDEPAQGLFVHKKAGFRDARLLARCGVEEAVFESYPDGEGDGAGEGGGKGGRSGGGDEGPHREEL